MLDVVGSLRRNDEPVVSLTEQRLVLPKAVLPSFWSAYLILGLGPVNGLPVLQGDVGLG